MNTPDSITAAGRTSALTYAALLLWLSFISSPLFAANAGLAHTLAVELNPASGELDVEDLIEIGDVTSRFEFVLNAGLTVTTPVGRLEAIRVSDDGLRTAYRVTLQTPAATLKLQYHGKPVFSARRSHGGMPQGVISEEAVYLDGSSAWYPQFGRDFDRLDMTVKLPEGWQSVSIGRRIEARAGVTWKTDQPHDELYLIAGRFTRHLRRHGDTDLSVWLLDDEPALADRYLGVMGGYIDHYSRLIGPYPYAKFAVVENPWQTGFGMPSFTLLGSRVLRLPFIPYTSLPHEILHNWWGNGVWVDYHKGNWSEGLTAYLADHWMQERQGKGDQYRLKALQRYSNFAARGEDVPLLQFVSRHSDSTQSIGYSKSLMLFHMLRHALGDERFITGLQGFWQTNRYRRVGFAEAIGGIAAEPRLADRFLPWLERTGAPEVRLGDAQVHRNGDGWQLELTIAQAQAGDPFAFDLPLAITLDGEPVARREIARIQGPTTALSYRFSRRPLRIDVDPEYDVLRYLDPTEQPPALNRLFGGTATWLVLPTAAPQTMREAWERLAGLWQERYPGLRPIDDTAAAGLDADSDRILLGWDNALIANARAAFTRDDQRLEEAGVVVGETAYRAAGHGVVLVNSDARGVTTGFIGAPTATAINTLAQKLTHYGGYGRLVFDAEGNNLVRDTLSSTHSRLSRQLGPKPVPLQMEARVPLRPGD